MYVPYMHTCMYACVHACMCVCVCVCVCDKHKHTHTHTHTYILYLRQVTGESAPVRKVPGDVVISGSVVRDEILLFDATRVGKDSFLNQLVFLVERAQASKAPIQLVADRISAVFVPVSLSSLRSEREGRVGGWERESLARAWLPLRPDLHSRAYQYSSISNDISVFLCGGWEHKQGIVLISVLTFLVWYICINLHLVPEDWPAGEHAFMSSFLFANAVVVVACPCALGLATPTAVMVGSGVGARLGILIKSGAALEIAHKVACPCLCSSPPLLDVYVCVMEGSKDGDALWTCTPGHM